MIFFQPAVLVGALGYFVDIYDLVLFAVLRQSSLAGLGLNATEVLESGIFLLNCQMAGLLLGGIVWGACADRVGRKRVLLGSIIVYSTATFANAFVIGIKTYALVRFFSGFGLAGELGAAITLVAEALPVRSRGLGTMWVAAIGFMGAIAAALVGESLPWRHSYALGGLLGFSLLLLRIRLSESALFQQDSTPAPRRGNWLYLLRSPSRLKRLLLCVAIGVPTYFIAGILTPFSPELAVALGVREPVFAAKSVLFGYLGVVFGDIGCAVVSQRLRSRKKAILLFLLLATTLTFIYLKAHSVSAPLFYLIVFGVGVSGGYWAVLITTTAELFGTNLRATATTSVPNFVRGAAIFLTLSFQGLKSSIGLIHSAWFIGAICLGVALSALSFLDETFSRTLEYSE